MSAELAAEARARLNEAAKDVIARRDELRQTHGRAWTQARRAVAFINSLRRLLQLAEACGIDISDDDELMDVARIVAEVEKDEATLQ